LRIICANKYKKKLYFNRLDNLFIRIYFLFNQTIIEINAHTQKQLNKIKKNIQGCMLHLLEKYVIILCENQVKTK
jgi:hypothetical protein